MDRFKTYYMQGTLYLMLALAALLSGCSGGRDEVLGSGGIGAMTPTVTSVAPSNNASGVPINIGVVSAEFSEPVSFGDAASFTITCDAPCESPVGTVSIDAAGQVAYFTLAPATLLEPQTLYTGMLSGAVSLASGAALREPFVWSFTTSSSSDTTRPRVTVTQPVTTLPGPTPDVPANTSLTAVFTEDMNPLSIDDSSFTLTCAFPCPAPAGSVSYSVGSRTAVFNPEAVLEVGTTYTATITSAATDLTGNELGGNQAPLPAASDYVWTFTTSVASIPSNVSVLSNRPLAGATGVCPNATVNATFEVPSELRMDPLTLTSFTFSVTGPSPALDSVQAASVTLDTATGRIATFVPLDPLTEGVTYTAHILGGPDGVKDLAIPANEMAQDFSWSFTAGPAAGNCLQPVALQSVAPFGTFGGTAGMTNEGIFTVIDGDIGTTATDNSSIVNFTDGNDSYNGSDGVVSGTIFTCALSTTGDNSAAVDPAKCDIATQARLDAESAYLELAGLPGGPDPLAGELGGLTLAPGTYTAAGDTFQIQGSDLTLDAQGDGNAVWVFQMASSLTVGASGAPRSVILKNGAQAKNIFWQVGSAATINPGGGGTMEGTIISQAGVTFSTSGSVDIVTLNGRAISLGASVTMVNTVINTPAP